MPSSDGKFYATDCANPETLFRIVQSIPSPKVEPLKRWLARVGRERIDEIENPELVMGRMQELYEKKGYPKSWIDKRMRGVAVRQGLTDEWKDRGARTTLEYALLTNEIMQGAFGMNVEDYKQVKSLERETLRDHMTDTRCGVCCVCFQRVNPCSSALKFDRAAWVWHDGLHEEFCNYRNRRGGRILRRAAAEGGV